MSAGDRDTLAALLRQHNDWMYALHSDFRTTTCVCGALEIGNMLDIEAPLAEEEHRNHVAEVLLASDWLAGVKAGAWDEGKKAAFSAWPLVAREGLINPHRIEGDDQ